jgi:hypothetical protein
MATLKTKIELYLIANSKTWEAENNNMILQNDGDGDYIRTWNVDGLTKPTADQLASYETAGNTAETLQGVLNTRANAYPTWQDQMDMQYKDLLNGTTTWKDAVAKVKSDNPKG